MEEMLFSPPVQGMSDFSEDSKMFGTYRIFFEQTVGGFLVLFDTQRFVAFLLMHVLCHNNTLLAQLQLHCL